MWYIKDKKCSAVKQRNQTNIIIKKLHYNQSLEEFLCEFYNVCLCYSFFFLEGKYTRKIENREDKIPQQMR